ncbi:MAG TPA: hypothetical protein VE093_39890 [Polyangiaceae bacterium]|nr:hypothetical protein [Polyangiaceae bacterium]
MRNRAFSSPPFERIGGAIRAGRVLASLALLGAPACGGSLTAPIPASMGASGASSSQSPAGGAGEVRLYELPKGYAWNLDRRVTGLSSTLDAVKDPSLCGDGIDESWSQLRGSLDALDDVVRSAPGGLITPEGPSRVWIQSIEPVDRSIAAYEKVDAKKEGTVTAGGGSIRVGLDAGVHRTSNASELLIGRQAYEVRLTDEAIACIRLNAKQGGRGKAIGPVWDRFVYGALEKTIVRASAFDVGGELTAPMLRVKGGLEESEISARVDQLGGHGRENWSTAPDVKRLLAEQRLNELLAQTNQFYDRTAIIAVREAAAVEGDPMPSLTAATGEEEQVPPETVVYFANTNDNDLDLWSSALPRGLCVVSRGGPPIDDEAAVRAAVKRDLGKWFDTGDVKTRGDCAPLRGPKPIRYFLINALTGKSYRVDPSEISRHYHFKAMVSDAAAKEASELAAASKLTLKQRNLWLLDRLLSGGNSLDAHRVLPEIPHDAAHELRSEYYGRLVEERYPSAADALRVLRSIAALRSKHGSSSLRYEESDILRVLAGGTSKEYGLKRWWPTGGNECKLQWHTEGAGGAGGGGARGGEWRLFCRGHLLELRNMDVWSSDFPSDIVAPQLLAVGADERRGAAPEGDPQRASKPRNPEVYGYILGDLMFFRREAMPQVLKALGERMSQTYPGTYSIHPGTSGLEWTVVESAITQVSATEEAPLASAPVKVTCARHYVQGRIAQLVCDAPRGFTIDQEQLGRSLGLSCQGTSTVRCTSRSTPSGRLPSGLAIPLIPIPPPALPESEGGGA